MQYPSIFNDVLGPVMRGPSSSHSAAALRIGRVARQLMDNDVRRLVVEYDPNGSLVTTHKSQGTDMGLAGGLLGWEPTDIRLIEYEKHLLEAGISVDVQYNSYGATHANTYKFTLFNDNDVREMTALSTGGGMIEIISIDRQPVSMNGDFYELLIFGGNVQNLSGQNLPNLEIYASQSLYAKAKQTVPFNKSIIDKIQGLDGIIATKVIDPVLPILGVENQLPFTTCQEMLEFNKDKNLNIWELAIIYEMARSGLTKLELRARMQELREIMASTIKHGIQGTSYEDRILPSQAPGFHAKQQNKSLIHSPLLNEIILSVTAVMEVKSSMGIIIAAPTAGSCGTLPGTVIGAANHLGKNEVDTLNALFAAGLIGVFIANGSTFAAEEAGCMAETGAAGSMAAAALVTFAGGTCEQAIGAASLALQNSFGLICDPIGNRVEAPCLGKNVSAASNALSCANMALADYAQLLPFDEVIEAMRKVGEAMPHEHCCTGLGGLAMTPTAQKLEASLENKYNKVGC